MRQQGDRQQRHEDDWWGQLYGEGAQDIGGAQAGDTLDDRFNSARDTLGTPRRVPYPPRSAPDGPRGDATGPGARAPRPPAAHGADETVLLDADSDTGADADTDADGGTDAELAREERAFVPGPRREAHAAESPAPVAASAPIERDEHPATPPLAADEGEVPGVRGESIERAEPVERAEPGGVDEQNVADGWTGDGTDPADEATETDESVQADDPTETKNPTEANSTDDPTEANNTGDAANWTPESTQLDDYGLQVPYRNNELHAPTAPAAPTVPATSTAPTDPLLDRAPWEPQPAWQQPRTFTARPPLRQTPEAGPSQQPAGSGATAGERGGGDGRRRVTYVGDGPPTYDPEPTALPSADPGAMDEVVADTVLDGARHGSCVLRAVSVRGDSARYRGEPRRDSLLTARFGSGEAGLVLVAMATGARATPGAHRAAAEACAWIGEAVGRSHARLSADIRAARRGDLKSGLQRLTDRSLGRLRSRAHELGVEPDGYSATLRCLLLSADPGCRTRVFFGVGGGGLFRLRDGHWEDIEPSPAETSAEGALGQAVAPGQDPRTALGVGAPPSGYRPATERPRDPFRFAAPVARPGDVLLLCTTGLAEPLHGEPALGACLAERWSAGQAPGLGDFLADAQVRVKGYADDRTAAAVWEA